MSARTSTKSASPPNKSIVSDEDAAFRARLGRAFLAACLVVRSLTGFSLVVSRFRACVRFTRVGAADEGAGGCTRIGAGGETSRGRGDGVGAGGGAGGGVTWALVGWGDAPGTGSGFGSCEPGGAGSGAGPSWARAGAANAAPKQNRTRRTDACRSNDLPERVMKQSPRLLLAPV